MILAQKIIVILKNIFFKIEIVKYHGQMMKLTSWFNMLTK
jgi:hypothetical protein